ncbi:MAG: hypothetical protein J1F14_00400 [Treponema sp.]|nr:hypothetical protein [Treponema sp.]
MEYTTDNDEANPFLTKLESGEDNAHMDGTEIKGEPNDSNNTDYKLKYGLNTVEIPFTANATLTNVFFRLSYVKVGTTFEFNKVELISVEGDGDDDETPAEPEPGEEDEDDGDDDDDEQSTGQEPNGDNDGE